MGSSVAFAPSKRSATLTAAATLSPSSRFSVRTSAIYAMPSAEIRRRGSLTTAVDSRNVEVREQVVDPFVVGGCYMSRDVNVIQSGHYFLLSQDIYCKPVTKEISYSGEDIEDRRY